MINVGIRKDVGGCCYILTCGNSETSNNMILRKCCDTEAWLSEQARKLQATLPIRNYHSPTDLLTGVRCRATSVAKNPKRRNKLKIQPHYDMKKVKQKCSIFLIRFQEFIRHWPHTKYIFQFCIKLALIVLLSF